MYIQSHQNQKPLVAFIGAAGHVGRSWVEYSGQSTIGLYAHEPVEDTRLVGQIANLDITDDKKVTTEIGRLARLGVRTVINAAGKVNVNAVELERGQENLPAFKVNVLGATNVAKACRQAGVKLIHLSTKAVIAEETPTGYPEIPLPDGDVAYTNSAPTWYGITKAKGEHEILSNYPEGSVVVRLENIHGADSMLWGGTARHLAEGHIVTRINDMFGSHLTDKTAVERLALIEQALHRSDFKPNRVYHIGARTVLAPYDAAVIIAQQLGVDESKITPMTQMEYVTSMKDAPIPVVPRPGYCYLDISQCEKDFGKMPTVREEITRFIELYGKEIEVK